MSAEPNDPALRECPLPAEVPCPLATQVEQPPPPPPRRVTGSTVRLDGDDLEYTGSPIRIKGVGKWLKRGSYPATLIVAVLIVMLAPNAFYADPTQTLAPGSQPVVDLLPGGSIPPGASAGAPAPPALTQQRNAIGILREIRANPLEWAGLREHWDRIQDLLGEKEATKP